MGVVINQSVKNTLITYIGFLIGAANTLLMYPHFLGKTYYGLTSYLLSSANIMMPLMAFGVHNTLIKFFNHYETEKEKGEFLNFALLLPLIFLIPLSLIGFLGYDYIATFLSRKNPIIYNYVWQIPVIALCMGYFEIFYAWVKVHMQSVFGSFIKEIVLRVLITIFLIGVYFKQISLDTFVYTLMIIYFILMLIMFFYAMKIKKTQLSFSFPKNVKEVLVYSVFIILSGSIANILLDIDKNMIGQYIKIENVAFYSVAVFIATVISVPSRAMHQITYPITSKLMVENKHDELNDLYKKTSISLQIVGGLVFLLIVLNINQLYLLLPKDYRGGVFVVFTIGLSKYFDLILGNNNAIIFNSKYYKAVLLLGLLLAVLAISLNMVFIPLFGIDGAAIATLISITLYSLAKLLFVVFKMKLYPFTLNTVKSFAILILTFFIFYYWDFSFHPILSIGIKSLIIVVFYMFFTFKYGISKEVNMYIKLLLNKIGVAL